MIKDKISVVLLKDMLRNYKGNKDRLNEIKEKINDGSIFIRESSSNDYYKTIEIRNNNEQLIKEIRKLKREILLSDLFMSSLSDEDLYLIKAKYIENRLVYDIIEEVYISESTYYRRMRRIFSQFLDYLQED